MERSFSDNLDAKSEFWATEATLFYTPAQTRHDSRPYWRTGKSGLRLPAVSMR